MLAAAQDADQGPTVNEPHKRKSKKRKGQHDGPLPTSLFIFTEKNIVRRCTRFLIEWPPFEYAVILTIIANCVVMASEEHLSKKDKTILAQELESTESYFLCIFTVEATVKIIALGLVLHENSYLRNIWNFMDFFVVVTGLCNVQQVFPLVLFGIFVWTVVAYLISIIFMNSERQFSSMYLPNRPTTPTR